MTRKDFELIAKRFAEQIARHPKGTPEHKVLSDAIGALCASFQGEYPNFKPATFVAACHGIR